MNSKILAINILGYSLTVLGADAVKLKMVASGFRQPVYATYAPGDSAKLFVVEQEGRIIVFENGKITSPPFFNIVNKVVSGGELGLLSVAFHPNYAKNRRFFVNYTTPKPELSSIVAEYKPGSPEEKVLIRVKQPYSNHNGGLNLFGPDGFLYIGFGDGGSGGDPHGHSQNLNSILGKMLRIDVDRGSPYAIPSDNPFAKTGGLPEIFAYGLRNPWRFSFDRDTKRLWVSDVGQNRREEIHVVEKGKNYGWNIMEGSLCYRPARDCPQESLELPIFEYGRDMGVSITGGYVYRGTNIPDLKGAYIYGDYGSGRIWALFYNHNTKTVGENRLLIETNLPLSSFGETPEGEILVVSHGGKIYELVKGT